MSSKSNTGSSVCYELRFQSLFCEGRGWPSRATRVVAWSWTA